MSVTENYPREYRGNEIYDEERVSELSPEDKPNLSLVQGQESVNRVLDSIGVNHDPSNVVAEDAYRCLLIDTKDGQYSEVWGIHGSIPYTAKTAVRLK